VTDQTRAIAPVHYAGVGCEMDAIMDLAARRDLMVVEDAAQAVGARFHGRYLGTIGHLGAYSFHETKNVVSGEGGALLINAAELEERAEIIREKGTNRKQFMRGQVSKYEWVEIGSSFLPSEITAAFLYAQLEEEGRVKRMRQAVWDLYHEALAELESEGFLSRPHVPEHCAPNGHLYYILTGDAQERRRLIRHLADRGITAVFHYVPLHTAPMGRKLGYREGDLPITEDLANRLLRLPLYAELQEEDVISVVKAVQEFYRG
jgi:dTDP-4-amino-4,6-dideoxygalactose transaminase